MTAAAAPRADEDIRAITPVPGATPQPRRRLWPWVLGGLLLLALLAAVAGATVLVGLMDLARNGTDGLGVTINGEHWEPGLMGSEHGLLALLAVASALFVVLLVVPLVVLLGLLVAALGVGIGLMAVVLVLAVALSPLWLLVLLLWLALRKPAAAPQPGVAA